MCVCVCSRRLIFLGALTFDLLILFLLLLPSSSFFLFFLFTPSRRTRPSSAQSNIRWACALGPKRTRHPAGRSYSYLKGRWKNSEGLLLLVTHTQHTQLTISTHTQHEYTYVTQTTHTHTHTYTHTLTHTHTRTHTRTHARTVPVVSLYR